MVVISRDRYMPEIVEIPIELTRFQLPEAVQKRLQLLLDRQDAGEELTQAERQEAEGLVELVEFLSLLRLRSKPCPAIAKRCCVCEALARLRASAQIANCSKFAELQQIAQLA